jgi:hypothetical protein
MTTYSPRAGVFSLRCNSEVRAHGLLLDVSMNDMPENQALLTDVAAVAAVIKKGTI